MVKKVAEDQINKKNLILKENEECIKEIKGLK